MTPEHNKALNHGLADTETSHPAKPKGKWQILERQEGLWEQLSASSLLNLLGTIRHFPT